MKNKTNLIDGYYNIVLDLNTRKLIVKNFLSCKTSVYKLCKTQTRLLLFLSDNFIKENAEIKKFVSYNNYNSVAAAIHNINIKINEIYIKNIHKKGYLLVNKILVDY